MDLVNTEERIRREWRRQTLKGRQKTEKKVGVTDIDMIMTASGRQAEADIRGFLLFWIFWMFLWA